ncbi:AraC family transcriptional regulator [uncultured Draconibacterium sp.]|uniref:AraC family transcriptional regulator n=1 Tax=uncultured Draconibacterium sp. TaxID=1573823 RepID=UPI0029BFB0F1|nr:AraC family transcriptional regulator [uncultured Draconibacterium sp.]
MADRRFHLNTFLNSDKEAFHIARTTINSHDGLQLHKHGFAEVFWIKAGKGIHLINNCEVPLEKGSLYMIRPEDKHTFKLDNYHENLVITNIAFYEESLNYYKERYFPKSDSYFWSNEKLPFSIRLNANQLNELSALADRLISQPRDFIHLDYIMIHIFRLVCSIESDFLHIPHWLAFALENYNSPENFKIGIQGFVQLTNRSIDHVNRVLQKHLKQTLTETVIKARLQYASQQLIMTNSSIKSICFDCGFDSVSYFYRLFKKYIGQTPADYRKKNRKVF